MILIKNQEVAINLWKGLINESKYSSPFQIPEFYEFYNTVEDFSADVFAVEEEGQFTSLVVVTIQKEQGIKSYFSRRGIIYGGPIFKDEHLDSLQFLLNYINQFYKRKLIYLETRNSFDFSDLKTVFKESCWKYLPYLNVQLLLSGRKLDDILKLMTYNRRREIKLSYQEGAKVYSTDSMEDVSKLYDILKDLYDSRVKLPLPPRQYFLSFLDHSIAKVFIVKHDENIIGGSFCFTDNNTSIYTSYYAGIRDYHKKIFPTHLAIIGVIEYAINNNINMVDFMGAGKPNIPYGVRDFKLQFGGDLVEHGRYLKIINPLLYKSGILGLKLLSKIK
jgi:serine/alanine adding enzyme